MGHERLGVLPRTARWRAVVDQIASASISPEVTLAVADATLVNVRYQFGRLANEEAVRAGLELLIALPLASRTRNPAQTLAQVFGIEIAGEPTPLAIVKAFNSKLNGFPRTEQADLATRAIADAVSKYVEIPRVAQADFFGRSQWEAWRRADSGAGFCELSRLYFSGLTERYLRYFLDREASAVIGEPARVEAFRRHVNASVDSVSRHAFETSKITQSFAAGWFQKHAKTGMPTSKEVRGFLSFALNKIREELRREANAS